MANSHHPILYPLSCIVPQHFSFAQLHRKPNSAKCFGAKATPIENTVTKNLFATLIPFSSNISLTACVSVSHIGEVVYKGRSEVYGARASPQVQLYQPQVCVHQRDGLPAAEGVLPQAQPVLGCKGKRRRHGGDDPFSRSLPQRVRGVVQITFFCSLICLIAHPSLLFFFALTLTLPFCIQPVRGASEHFAELRRGGEGRLDPECPAAVRAKLGRAVRQPEPLFLPGSVSC